MPKVVFMGAGSAVFARRVLGDVMLSPALSDVHIALYDINRTRLDQSEKLINSLNEKINHSRAKITAHLGVENRKLALKNANYIINAVQIGGYEPSTVIDFEIPKKYGLRKTIGDTIGIGGIFRALRTAPVMLEFAKDIEQVCPGAWFLNYTNPMAILTGTMLKATNVKTVGLCHSVQVCATTLLNNVGLKDSVKKLQWKIAGINHMAWLLEIKDGGKDLYPKIKQKAAELNKEARKDLAKRHDDMVRFEIMLNFGYYVTESSEHSAEYSPYWIKSNYPELIEEFKIPLDEYPRRCVNCIERWNNEYESMLKNDLKHEKSGEYAGDIIEAIESGNPVRVHGNIINNNLITNLPSDSIVEVPCLVDHNGVQGCYIGDLPQQCAALNRTNINPQLIAIEAVLSRRKEYIYQAAMLDPHTASELPIDKIKSLCDDLLAAHSDMIPIYR